MNRKVHVRFWRQVGEGDLPRLASAVRASAGEAKSFTYTGEQVDESALVFLRARHYDPSTGAFLQKDRLATLNRYAYAGGNPVRYVDPAGTDLEDAWEFLQGVNHGFSDSVSFGMAAQVRAPSGVQTPDSELYYLGRALGDLGGFLSGAGTTGSGVAGVVASPAAGPAAPAVVVVSGGRVILGGTIAANSAGNAGRDLGTFFSKRTGADAEPASQGLEACEQSGAPSSPPRLAFKPTLTQGDRKMGLEHIVARHWHSSGAPGSKFAASVSVRDLRQLINDAAVQGAWRQEGANTVIEANLHRNLGVDAAGARTEAVRVVMMPDGRVVTAYPIPVPAIP